MKSVTTALLLTAVSAFGMAQKPKVTVRFHSETNPNDSGSFSMPAKLMYMQRAARLEVVPVVSERDLLAIFPFKTADGSWGCVFQFDDRGRNHIEVMSTSKRNTALVLFVGTKAGQHQVADMLVDRPVTDGRITVPRGLSDMEVLVMKQQFRVLGAETAKEKKEREKKEKQEKKPADPTDWTLNRRRDGVPPGQPATPPPQLPPPVDPNRKAPPAPGRRELRELDLPRVAD